MSAPSKSSPLATPDIVGKNTKAGTERDKPSTTEAEDTRSGQSQSVSSDEDEFSDVVVLGGLLGWMWARKNHKIV